MYFISSPVEANIECQAILKTHELFIYEYATLLIQFVKEVYYNYRHPILGCALNFLINSFCSYQYILCCI